MRRDPGAFGRLAVTLLLPALAWALGRIPLPGLELGALARDPVFDRHLFGVTALGLRSVIWAALLVEALALIVPRWREWRVGGYDGRARLQVRTMVLAAVFLAGQAYAFVSNLQGLALRAAPALLFQAPEGGPLVSAAVASLVAGSFALVWLARLIDRHGCGSGFAVMIVASEMLQLGRLSSVKARLAADDTILMPLLLGVVAIGVLIRLTGGQPLRRASAPAVAPLPTPASGLQPATVGAWGVWLVPRLLGDVLDAGSWSAHAVEAVFVAGLAALCAYLFTRAARRPVRSALVSSVAICLAVTGLGWWYADARLAIDLLSIVSLGCLAADVLGELRFRRAHGALAPIRPVHRLWALPDLLEMLAVAGIPAYPRARHYRTLWSYFTPLVPVDILVPVARAEAALGIVGAWQPSDAGPPGVSASTPV